jgi:hypothetical protein
LELSRQCSGGVHLRLTGGDETEAVSSKESCSAILQGRAALCPRLKPRTTFVERAGTRPTPPVSNLIVVRPFKVVQCYPCPRLKPRTTFVEPAGTSPAPTIHRLMNRKTDNPPNVQQYHFSPGYERCIWQPACNLRLVAKNGRKNFFAK